MNESLVYLRPLDPRWPRRFGLFCFADQHEIIARNITMRGDWPKQLPTQLLLEDPRPKKLDAESRKLAAVFTHDFRNRERTDRFINELTFGSNAEFTNVADGLRATVPSFGQWEQCGLSPSFSVSGDFDLQASFTSLDVGEPTKSGLAQMTLQLKDQYDRKLMTAIGHDEWNDDAARGQVALTSADGSKRFSSKNSADESKSGRLRMARRGDQFYSLFAQADSPHWRVLHQETVSTGPIDFGGIQCRKVGVRCVPATQLPESSNQCKCRCLTILPQYTT